jgi:uncharacterized membrane protein
MTSEREEQDAAWGQTAHREPRWPASLAIVATVVLYYTLPDRYVVGGYRWIYPLLVGLILLPLYITAPQRHPSESNAQRIAAIVLIAIVNAVNVLTLILLIHTLVTRGTSDAALLLGSAAAIWSTNVIVFALWYWELDRGGPAQRMMPPQRRREPDFLFPQMSNPACTHGTWWPSFLDYLYVSLTNATAFSPTDTLPLTLWAKSLMGIQSLISLVTVGLVAARAVNILK